LRYEVDVKSLSLTPKDAEFLGALNWSLEDIARAYSVPIDKIGGKRTYQNVEESEKVFWHDCMVPEAQFIAAELTEQLLPHFGDNLLAEFDLSDVGVLSEGETEKWTRIKEQIERGWDSINNLRKADGLDPVPWGDVFWMDGTKIAINSNEKPEPVIPPALMAGAAPKTGEEDEDEDKAPEEQEPRSRTYSRMIAYGSDEHQRLWERYLLETEPRTDTIGRTAKQLMQDQRQSVLANLRKERTHARDIADFADDPFDKPRWTKTFRQAIRPVLLDIVKDTGETAMADLGVAIAFDVQDPNVLRAVERQAQKFAVEVNDTTWRALRDSLRDGIDAGESIDGLAERVEGIMADRIRSSGTTIARTETTRASTTGTHESWRQSGVVTHVHLYTSPRQRHRNPSRNAYPA